MATFGNTSAGANVVGLSATYLRGFKFTGGPTSGTLSSLSVYGATSIGGGQNIQLAIYSATTGNLIASTSNIATTTTAGWWTGSASGTLNDSAGAYYLCIEVATGGNWNAQAATGSATNGYASETFGTWPGTIPSLTAQFGSDIFSIYATYTTGGGTVNSGFFAFM